MKYLFFIFHLSWLTLNAHAAEPQTIKIGVQATGTLLWELAVLLGDEQFKSPDYLIETQELANAEAGKIALQSGSVDMIVSDWIWVSRLRADGSDFTFYPYSTTSGALMVPDKSSIQSIRDLQGKRIGIAGGELDKNWLLLQALAKQEKLDLNASVEKIFAAPPLIDEQLKQSRIDAALNYWHFSAKLETQGYRQIIEGKGILNALGIQEPVPSLGYVFKQSWADKNKKGLNLFFKASAKAKTLICTTDAGWSKVLPLLQTDDVEVQKKMRQRYCDGEVKNWGKTEQQSAERIYAMLRQVSDNQLTGKSERLQPGTFWTAE